MTSTRPYLIRALYEWIADNGYTPYLLVDASRPDVDAPLEYAEEDRLVLNVAPRAVQGLRMGNDWIDFSARFGGVARSVTVPVSAVMAIYARENGQGMIFGEAEEEGEAQEPEPQQGADGEPSPGTGGGGGRPHLRVVK